MYAAGPFPNPGSEQKGAEDPGGFYRVGSPLEHSPDMNLTKAGRANFNIESSTSNA